MRTAIKRIGRKGSDGEFDEQKGAVANRQQLAHQAIAFGGDICMNPEECELCVKPIQHKEKKTFCECAHFVWSTSLPMSKIVEPRTFGTAKPPNHWLGGSAIRTGRNETRFVLTELNFQSHT